MGRISTSSSNMLAAMLLKTLAKRELQTMDPLAREKDFSKKPQKHTSKTNCKEVAPQVSNSRVSHSIHAKKIEQMDRIDERQESIARIRMLVDDYDKEHRREAEEEVDIKETKGAVNRLLPGNSAHLNDTQIREHSSRIQGQLFSPFLTSISHCAILSLNTFLRIWSAARRCSRQDD